MISTDGSPQEWDANWKTLAPCRQVLYEPASLRTIVQFWHRSYFEDLWSEMGDRACSARYIELGAGRGTTSMYLCSRHCDVTLVDLSAAAFRLARQNYEQAGLPLPTLVAADVRNTKLAASSFDCAFSIGLLEHFEDPRPVLAEALRLLSPGGLLFMVIVPARADCVKWLIRLIFRPWRLGASVARSLFANVRKGGIHPVANQFYRAAHTRQSYENWLRELGAERVTCVPYNPYHSVYRNDVLNRRVVLPIYQLHHAVKRCFRSARRLKTHPSLAICDLLTGRKAVAT